MSAFTTEDGDVVTAASHAAGMIMGVAKTDYTGVTKVITARVNLMLACHVFAIAHKSGLSRNAMITTILDAGIEAINAELPDEVLLEIEALKQEFINIAIEEIEQ